MTKVFLGTGKKKKIQALIDYYQGLQRKKKISILSLKVTTKRALFWNYDELRLLFDPLDGGKGIAPDKLLNALDSQAYREQAMVLLDFSSPRKEDEMMKVKILTLCHSYLSQGVQIKVNVKEFKENEYRRYFQCKCQLKGPISSIVNCKDDLIRDGLCEEKTVSYVF